MHATTLYDLPSSAEAEMNADQRKAEAVKHFEAIKQAGEIQSKSSLCIGWHAYVLKRDNLFGMLGHQTEEESRLAAGVSRTTWYINIRLAEAFNGLEEKQFVSMKWTNASALADMPESQRLSREWIRAAGIDSIQVFADKVDEAMQGKARPSDGKEQGVVLKMSMPASRKKVVETKLKEYAKSIGINEGDTGRAVETLLIEKTGQVGLIEAITNATARIKQAYELRDSGLSAEETLTKVYDLLGDMALDFQSALNSVHNMEESGAA
jgi:hypothetical protein